MTDEQCVHTKTIKYLYKYIHKRNDRAIVVIESMSLIQMADNVL